jgi:CheY-like chemotaxis protein
VAWLTFSQTSRLIFFEKCGVLLLELSLRDWTPVTKVLVVDDERVLADLLVTILNGSGFNASAAYSGAEAVKAAGSLKPDLIISDVFMPDMNGVEAMILIRGILPGCKIILYSGNANSAVVVDRLESARAQGHNFKILSKPFSPKELLATLAVEFPL